MKSLLEYKNLIMSTGLIPAIVCMIFCIFFQDAVVLYVCSLASIIYILYRLVKPPVYQPNLVLLHGTLALIIASIIKGISGDMLIPDRTVPITLEILILCFSLLYLMVPNFYTKLFSYFHYKISILNCWATQVIAVLSGIHLFASCIIYLFFSPLSYNTLYAMTHIIPPLIYVICIIVNHAFVKTISLTYKKMPFLRIAPICNGKIDRVNRSFDTKLNRFMDDLFNGFQRFLGSFTSLQMDDVVRLVFEVLVILLLLAVLHIPFRMISSLGSSLLHSVAGYGIGGLLAAIWRFIIGVAYVAIFVVVLVNLCTKRLNRYRSHARHDDGASVFDDFKESFDFDQAKETVHSFTNGRNRTRRDTIYDDRDDVNYQESKQDSMNTEETEDAYADESTYKEPRRREYRRYHEDDHLERGVTSVATILMRIFFCLMMIPFVGIIIGLCCALGAMIVLSVEGLTLIGAYFIVIGALVATGGFLSLLYSVLWRRG